MFLQESRENIEKLYQKHNEKEQLSGCSFEEALALKYLYCCMPISDKGNYNIEIFKDYAVHSVWLWENKPYVKKIPEEIFRNYILYHRVNEEEIDICRTIFYQAMEEYYGKDWMDGKSMEEIVLEVNYWCAIQVSYHCADDRTASAKSIYESGYGRCGEESVFAVQALRSVGIPARQVYAPRWSHCDDNHAWVEVWCDGEWKFLGACEPDCYLNRGWFLGASSRAMLIRSMEFEPEEWRKEKEEVVGKEGIVTFHNQLSRYADEAKLEILVQDAEGKPVPDAEVELQIFNYSAFYPIAPLFTNKEGRVTVHVGKGSLLISVKYHGMRKEQFITVEKNVQVICILKNYSPLDQWIDFVQKAPEEKIRSLRPVDIQKDSLHRERMNKISRERDIKLAKVKNYELENFLIADKTTEKYRKALISRLTEKDLTDCKQEILEEHLEEAMPYVTEYPEEIFISYVLNPRVEFEVLSKYRKTIKRTFSESERVNFKENPCKIWEWIKNNIHSEETKERYSLYTTPEAALSMKIADEKSQKLLFTAIARSLGIPAKLDEKNKTLLYWKNGNFNTVVPEEEESASLELYAGDYEVEWVYYQNFTLAKLENDNWKILGQGEEKFENGVLVLKLPAGIYRICTGNRLPDGGILGKYREFELKEAEKKSITMELAQASKAQMFAHYHLPDFTLASVKELQSKYNASDLIKEDMQLFLWLKAGEEPSEHILNELIERASDFQVYASRISFVIEKENESDNPTMKKCLELIPQIQIWKHDFGMEAEQLARRLYIEPQRWPLLILARKQEDNLLGLYGSSGYNVGTGDLMLKLFRIEESMRKQEK